MGRNHPGAVWVLQTWIFLNQHQFWNDPRNQIEQTMQLTPDGIRETALRPAQLSKAPEAPVSGAPVKPGRAANLVRHWRFGEDRPPGQPGRRYFPQGERPGQASRGGFPFRHRGGSGWNIHAGDLDAAGR